MPQRSLKAGKFFLLAEEPELALEQALQIDISGNPAHENSPAVEQAGCWPVMPISVEIQGRLSICFEPPLTPVRTRKLPP